MLKNTVNTFVLAAIAASEVSAETDADGNFVPGPVAVIHGMNSSCPMEFWVDAIAEAIDYKAVCFNCNCEEIDLVLGLAEHFCLGCSPSLGFLLFFLPDTLLLLSNPLPAALAARPLTLPRSEVVDPCVTLRAEDPYESHVFLHSNFDAAASAGSIITGCFNYSNTVVADLADAIGENSECDTAASAIVLTATLSSSSFNCWLEVCFVFSPRFCRRSFFCIFFTVGSISILPIFRVALIICHCCRHSCLCSWRGCLLRHHFWHRIGLVALLCTCSMNGDVLLVLAACVHANFGKECLDRVNWCCIIVLLNASGPLLPDTCSTMHLCYSPMMPHLRSIKLEFLRPLGLLSHLNVRIIVVSDADVSLLLALYLHIL